MTAKLLDITTVGNSSIYFCCSALTLIRMPKRLECLLYTVSCILIINASLVLYDIITSHSLHTEYISSNHRNIPVITELQATTASKNNKNDNKSTSVYHCCSCNLTQGNLNHKWKKKVDYQQLATAVPHLDPNHYTATRTRLGSEVKFNINLCPSDSVMLKHNSNNTPLHLDCPTLFVVGARKAGTSSLYQYVTKHPDFEGTRLDWGPKVGETFYFSSHYKTSWERYIQLFPSDGVMTGDASVGNFVECRVPKRLFESCGKQAKVVMMFRDPVNRFVSNFAMRAQLGSARVQNMTSITTFTKLHLDYFFHNALERKLDVTKMPESWTKLRCLFSPAINMVYEGLYYVHLLNWLCNFPAENILIINSEEFYQKPSIILTQVFQFLGLKELDFDTLQWITANVYNKGKYNIPDYQKLSSIDRKKLLGVYLPFNKALFEILGWHGMEWNS